MNEMRGNLPLRLFANAFSESFILLSGGWRVESFRGRADRRLGFYQGESFSFILSPPRDLFRVLLAERGENGGDGEIGK